MTKEEEAYFISIATSIFEIVARSRETEAVHTAKRKLLVFSGTKKEQETAGTVSCSTQQLNK